jgi:hypothetical protein
MKTTHSFCKIFLLLLFGFPGTLAHSADSEWVTLIDGIEGLDNFELLGDANWSAKMSAIQATEGSGASFLVSRENYGDFSLRVEFWASDDANSGIFLRCQEPSNINDRNCYEANIFDQRPDPSYGTGGIVHIAPVAEPRPTAGDKWNIYKMTLRGDHLVVELNGKKTVDVRDSQFGSGPFALQWGRGALRFRKVEIMEL